MANKPRGQFKFGPLRMLLIVVTLAGVCGCEVGKTMFQYGSGGSPWVGINLLPKKARATEISHKKTVPSSKQDSKSHRLSFRKKPPKAKFHKQPLRLNLPSSQSSNQNKNKDFMDLEDGSIPVSRVVNF
ncbi:MAG: hypothetical protein JKY95_03115 [Planctomycetaceae bacterium]|nr:hypothetical protein [Planctomycetaceae bacterium]